MGREQLGTGAEFVDRAAATRRAAVLFTNASREYSASASAQGAHIALSILEQGITTPALELGQALASDQEAISRLLVTATEYHRSKGLHFPLSEGDVLNVVGAGFAHAHVMSTVDGDVLRGFLQKYHERRATQRRGKFNEPDYRRYVHDMLNAHGVAQVFYRPVSQDLVDSVYTQITGRPVRRFSVL